MKSVAQLKFCPQFEFPAFLIKLAKSPWHQTNSGTNSFIILDRHIYHVVKYVQYHCISDLGRLKNITQWLYETAPVLNKLNVGKGKGKGIGI